MLGVCADRLRSTCCSDLLEVFAQIEGHSRDPRRRTHRQSLPHSHPHERAPRTLNVLAALSCAAHPLDPSHWHSASSNSRTYQ